MVIPIFTVFWMTKLFSMKICDKNIQWKNGFKMKFLSGGGCREVVLSRLRFCSTNTLIAWGSSEQGCSFDTLPETEHSPVASLCYGWSLTFYIYYHVFCSFRASKTSRFDRTFVLSVQTVEFTVTRCFTRKAQSVEKQPFSVFLVIVRGTPQI